MIINTCSGAISFSRKLETESAAFYEAAAGHFSGDAEMFSSFAIENKKFITQIERAYYGVITDAIEGCFAFDLETDGYELGDAFSGQTGRADALKIAIEMEEKIINYYKEAAEQSKHLMADVPRSFNLVVKKRSGRIPRLKALLEA
ncbi:MAG TPA: hypothetical protein PLR60_00180 [Syntrophorhabdaceae bacterium]|nr:hypothetical protein [Syntrophorhabdaceae bacterium]